MPRSRLRFRINAKVNSRLKRAARLHGMPPARLTQAAVEWFLARKELEAQFPPHIGDARITATITTENRH